MKTENQPGILTRKDLQLDNLELARTKLTRFLHRTTVIETDSGALMTAASSSFAIVGYLS